VPSERVGHDGGMADEWITVKASEVKAGDFVRHRGAEFEVARIDDPFLGRDVMLCLIEDNDERWNAYPSMKDGDIEVRRSV
jgi:hypothetical protein